MSSSCILGGEGWERSGFIISVYLFFGIFATFTSADLFTLHLFFCFILVLVFICESMAGRQKRIRCSMESFIGNPFGFDFDDKLREWKFLFRGRLGNGKESWGESAFNLFCFFFDLTGPEKWNFFSNIKTLSGEECIKIFFRFAIKNELKTAPNKSFLVCLLFPYQSVNLLVSFSTWCEKQMLKKDTWILFTYYLTNIMAQNGFLSNLKKKRMEEEQWKHFL